MIVWCGRCTANPVDLTPGGIDAVSWFGMTAERPWCWACCLWAMLQWPNIGILVATPIQRRRMRDADTCGMGDEKPCEHGVRAGRFCIDCDNARFYARFT